MNNQIIREKSRKISMLSVDSMQRDMVEGKLQLSPRYVTQVQLPERRGP